MRSRCRSRRWRGLALALALCILATPAAAQTLSRPEAFARAQALAKLGEVLFADPALSASGKLACASCHSPAHDFGPPNGLAVQSGGVDLAAAGVRAVPSLKYLNAVPPFTEHFFESEDEADGSIDNGPTGGLGWDGRFDRGRDQARFPLFSRFEMANASAADIAAKAAGANYASDLKTLFGDDIFNDPGKTVTAITTALEAFEQDPRFYPYDSLYDAYLAGTATLTAAQARGLALFTDPAKGNCAICHVATRGLDGTPPQFTDFGFIAVGLPRNPAIPANADPAYADLGLCGPYRTDFGEHPHYCGLFRTPSLRNVARRGVFFHNGVIHTLRDAVAFYATRDTDPGRWYPKDAAGEVRKFDDLPAAAAGNVNMEAPFGGKPGEAPSLTDAEIDDIVAFLQTLNDGTGSPPPVAPTAAPAR